MSCNYQGYMNGDWALRPINHGRSQADMSAARHTPPPAVEEQREARKMNLAALLATLPPLDTGVPSIRAIERYGNLIAPRLIATPAAPGVDFLNEAQVEKEPSREERREAHMNRLCGPPKTQ